MPRLTVPLIKTQPVSLPEKHISSSDNTSRHSHHSHHSHHFTQDEQESGSSFRCCRETRGRGRPGTADGGQWSPHPTD